MVLGVTRWFLRAVSMASINALVFSSTGPNVRWQDLSAGMTKQMGNREPGCVAYICATGERRSEIVRTPICQPSFLGSCPPGGLIVNKMNSRVPRTRKNER